ncbi:hypothetical protein C2869_08495 [Saccharobesus litoralis]|uniref:Lcl C-terminal domain-containing protein n=1 Tax=Saccharobesus litoralis TaxID=2172099 RepID=A0A2S0VQG7_9ALTE|nr:hypothetical protein C2869_08495 [Saccharobesus litoralis]
MLSACGCSSGSNTQGETEDKSNSNAINSAASSPSSSAFEQEKLEQAARKSEFSTDQAELTYFDIQGEQHFVSGQQVELPAKWLGNTEASHVEYRWQQLTEFELAQLVDDQAVLSFVAPQVNHTELVIFNFSARIGAKFIQQPVRLFITPKPKSNTAESNVAPWQINLPHGLVMQPAQQKVLRPEILSQDEGLAVSAYTYLWQQVLGEPILLEQAKRETLNLKIPEDYENQLVELSLTVTNEQGISQVAYMQIDVVAPDKPPLAHAGHTLYVSGGETVILDASKTQDELPEYLEYYWLQTDDSGLDVNLNDPYQQKTKFVAPEVEQQTRLNFSLEVTDRMGQLDSALAHVVILPFNKPQNKIDRQVLAECVDFAAFNRADCQSIRQGGESANAIFGSERNIGHGWVGFSKLDEQGRPLADDAPSWHCVRDNSTGLIWQVKKANIDALLSAHHRYFWRKVDEKVKARQNLSRCRQQETCYVEDYVRWINSQNFCGLSDWRVPSVVEGMTLLHNHYRMLPKVKQNYLVPAGIRSRFWATTSSNAYSRLRVLGIDKNGQLSIGVGAYYGSHGLRLVQGHLSQ